MGVSRKSFLSPLMARAGERETAAERDYASAAGVAACVAQGADILRVHNVQAGVDAARVADAVWPKSVLNEGLRNL